MKLLIWLILMAFGTASSILRGWVITVLWTWFIMPKFNAPAISVLFAIGLSFYGGLFTSIQSGVEDQSDEWYDKGAKNIITSVCVSLLALLAGKVTLLFM